MTDHARDDVTTRPSPSSVAWFDALLVPAPDGSGAVAPDVVSELEELGIHVRVLEAGELSNGEGEGAVGEARVGTALEELAGRGIGAGLVGVVGPLAAPPVGAVRAGSSLAEVLAAQRQLRVDRQVPPSDRDPGWILELTSTDRWLERVEEALCTLSDGRVATRGSLEEDGAGSEPLVSAAGCYMPGTGTHVDATPTLLPGPLWHGLLVHADALPTTRRVLDLRTGTLRRESSTPRGVIRTIRFHSLARPGLAVLLAEGHTGDLAPGADLAIPPDAPSSTITTGADLTRATTSAPGHRIDATARTIVSELHPGRRTVERRVVLTASADGRPTADVTRATAALDGEATFTDLLAEHRARWAERWSRADVVLGGDPELQVAVRFGLFHLMSAAAEGPEAAVGARGLTGGAYRGHVFWDADVFVLPFLAATQPTVARAMVDYRLARLPAARRAAATAGHDGARFPWESAGTGEDVTPQTVIGWGAESVPVLTGRYQEHITADVAWGVVHYARWTGDGLLERGPGRRLLLETARYWASRVSWDADGTAHLREVMGPDEYHAPVDDDVFTNAMAAWNLRRAAGQVRAGDPPALRREADRWRHTAAALADGFDPSAGRHVQFHGYDELEPVRVDDLAPPPFAADVLLGLDAVAPTQMIKQADVIMRHHLLPDSAPPGSLIRDLDHYLPRTTHGSSLSPGVHASALARAGRPDEALPWLRMAARIDLDDPTVSTAGGVHLAAAGSVWQALTHGFLGVRPGRAALRLDPRLPTAWDRLRASLTWRGTPLTIDAAHDGVRVASPGRVTVDLGSGPHRVTAPGASFRRRRGRWAPTGR